MKKIGITGNIGSGKTTACEIFESMGIQVCYADALAKYLMTTRLSLRHEIISIFGAEAFVSNGDLNRKVIGAQLFHDVSKKNALESIVHPAVHEYLSVWFEEQEGPYALEEAALIYESGGNQQLDAVIWVDAPLDLRMERVMKRDKITKEAALSREQNQWPAAKKINLADYVIKNDETRSLIQQIQVIHQKIIES